MTENTNPEPMPADVPQPRPPFNEVSVLFPLLTFYTVAYLGMMASEFILRGAFVMPAGLMPIYIALTGAYAVDKEIRRWIGIPEPARKGSGFVYLWSIFYLVAFMIRSFRPDFALPGELGPVALQVLGIFFGSRASKYVWERRGRTVPDVEIPAQGDKALELIRVKGRITNREVTEALLVSTASAKRILAALAASGQILAKGVGRGIYYIRAPEDRDQTSGKQ
jgi:hypothetical protein